jgi:methylmalonyl-CoA mutase C-terminal domain/subunit
MKTGIRVLIAKPGLDGHDKGAKIVAKGLMEAGMEVIYTGIRQTVDSIVNVAIQEGVDVIGLSVLSGTHVSNCRELMEKLEKEDLHRDLFVIVGGIIPKKDVRVLKDLGIAEVFRPNSTMDQITRFIQEAVAERNKKQSA